jgi:DNA segregation ATPase FtsK/SpoIIIE, S-DNA-T family
MSDQIKYKLRIEAVLAKRVPRDKDKDGDGLPWRLISKRETEHTYDYAYEVPVGYSLLDMEKQIDALYASCGRIVELEDRAGAIIVSVVKNDFPKVLPFVKEHLTIATEPRHILLGFNRREQPVVHDFVEPHLLIGGSSGMGKTDFIRWTLAQLMLKHSPNDLHIHIIDLKGFSFIPFRNVPHVKSISRDLPTSMAVLQAIYYEMRRRSDLVWASGERDCPFPWIFLLIDEAAQLAPSTYRQSDLKKIAGHCDNLLAQIACIGREAHISLCYATQRPDAEVINPQVKQNMSRSIAFRCKTASNSKIILDKEGAEQLPEDRPGRCIYSARKEIVLQVPFIGGDDAWRRFLQPSTEVRSDQDRRITSGDIKIVVGDPDRVDRSSRVIDPVRITSQASIGGTAGAQRKEASGGKAARDRKVESVAVEQVRTSGDEFDENPDAIWLPED